MHKLIKLLLPFIFLSAALALAAPVLAQSALTLRVNKDFGYNSGGDIRGTFTLSASGPDDLAWVVFLLDGQEIGRADAAPFELQIHTDSYPAGEHTLQARGQLAGGSTVETLERQFRFVTRDEEASGMQKILVPLLGGIALVTILGFALQFLSARNRPASPVDASGGFAYRGGWGAICPHCHLPTNIHFLSINLGFMTKLDRCDNCGKWGLMRVRNQGDMDAYIHTLQKAGKAQVQPESDEEKLRRQLDDSRYTNR